MSKQQKKSAGKGKAAAEPKGRGKAPEPPKAECHVFTMADYRAMEKAARSIETACRIRRKYVMAMQTATEMIDRNLDKLLEIVWTGREAAK